MRPPPPPPTRFASSRRCTPASRWIRPRSFTWSSRWRTKKFGEVPLAVASGWKLGQRKLGQRKLGQRNWVGSWFTEWFKNRSQETGRKRHWSRETLEKRVMRTSNWILRAALLGSSLSFL